MTYAKRIYSLLALAGYLLIVTGCGQKSNCNGISFGGGGGSGAGGSLSGAGNACSASSAASGGGGGSTDLLYYLGGGTVIDAAGINSSTFANLVGYTATAFPNGTQLGENFWIVNKRFLYVPGSASTVGGVVFAYAITRSNGALTAIGTGSFATGTTFADIAVSDPQGRFLYVSDLTAGTITVFKVDATTGALTISGSPVPGGAGANQMVVDGTGNHLYFADGLEVFGFSIDQTSGTLTPLSGSPFNLPMATLQADSTGQFLLGVTGADPNVNVIPIGAGTGSLGLPTAFPTVSDPNNLALSANGKFLFTFAVDSNNRPLPIEGFTFDATKGMLTTMANSPFVNLPKVNTGVFDQNGTVLLGATTTSFFVYSIDSTSGTPTSPLPALGVAHDQRYAITN
jgi:6-phosphogluconolactonase (cycloisomerase 2 family)